MSQHDYDLANGSGAAFRVDINNALLAIVSRNSGGSAPSATFPYEVWVDTTSGTIKHRNAANSGWLVDSTADESFVLSRSSNTLLDVSDIGKTIVATSSFTQTFDAAATLGDGWNVSYRNDGAGDIIFDPNGSETIDGVTTLVLSPGEACRIWCNGSALKTVGLRRLASSTQATTSGTTKDFTIPAWAKRIIVMVTGVSFGASDSIIVQLGDAGGIETTGYTGAYQQGGTTAALSSGFLIGLAAIGAGDTWHGIATIIEQDASSNTWVCSATTGHPSAVVLNMGGSKSLSQELTTVRVTGAGGQTFDAGAVTVSWE